MWGEPDVANLGSITVNISTHSPRVGRTPSVQRACAVRRISTHSPRVGRTAKNAINDADALNFNSLAPCGANRRRYGARRKALHFNSLAPCGANPVDGRVYVAAMLNFNSLAPCGANRT